MKIDFFERVVMKGCPIFTNNQREASEFLEEHGLRFLKEYGCDNCEAIARSMGWLEFEETVYPAPFSRKEN